MFQPANWLATGKLNIVSLQHSYHKNKECYISLFSVTLRNTYRWITNKDKKHVNLTVLEAQWCDANINLTLVMISGHIMLMAGAEEVLW